MNRTALTIGLAAFVAGACGPAQDAGSGSANDPRTGDNGRIRFVGGGCNSSTTMAVGSKQVLTLEAAEGTALPPAISVEARAPEVIAASEADTPGDVLLEAKAEGSSVVEVLSRGDAYDRLAFDAEPATSVHFTTVPRVFEGGHADIVVNEVFGSCGQDCPLFGHSFLSWRSDPPGAFELIADERGTASFLATDTGMLLGAEPVTGDDLVGAEVIVVPRDGVTGFSAIATTLPLMPDEPQRVFDLPGELSSGEAFCVQLMAERGELPPVPLSRRDVRWTIDGGSALALPMSHASEPLGTMFYAGDVGPITLTATSQLLPMDASFIVEVN